MGQMTPSMVTLGSEMPSKSASRNPTDVPTGRRGSSLRVTCPTIWVGGTRTVTE